jgi:hypothetical protein
MRRSSRTAEGCRFPDQCQPLLARGCAQHRPSLGLETCPDQLYGKRIVVNCHHRVLPLRHCRCAVEGGQQLLLAHRLDEVFGGAQRETAATLIKHRHHDHRYRCRPRVCLELGENLPAVNSRQKDVEDNACGTQPAHRIQAFFAVSGADDAGTRRLEIDPQQIEGPPVVFHDNDGGPRARGQLCGET